MATPAAQQPAPAATIPVSSSDPNINAAANAVQQSAVRAFFGRILEGTRGAFSQRKPWTELVDRSAMAKPESVTEATSRIRKNLSYFRVNYLIVVSLCVAASLVTHPVSLFVLAGLLCGWIFLYLLRTEPLTLFGRTYSEREILGILAVLTIFVVFLTEVGSLVISALMFGIGIVCLHGAFRMPDDLFLDEQDNSAPGFLSLFSYRPVPAVSNV